MHRDGSEETAAAETAVQDLQHVCREATASRGEALQKDGIGECHFFFGICTDVQWAEIPDLNVHKGTTRCAQFGLVYQPVEHLRHRVSNDAKIKSI